MFESARWERFLIFVSLGRRTFCFFLFDTTGGLGSDELMTIDVPVQSFMYILRSMIRFPWHKAVLRAPCLQRLVSCKIAEIDIWSRTLTNPREFDTRNNVVSETPRACQN